MGLILSTSWNAFRYNKAENIISEIKNLGFQEIELSFNLTASIVGEIRKASRNKQIKAISVHNFCPIPRDLSRKEALPDSYSLASCDRNRRSLAVKYTKLTIDTAHSLKAKAVVLHCGRVDIPDYTRKLIKIYNRKGSKSEEFRRTKELALKERACRYRPFFENALESLEILNKYAKKRKIYLGIENRFYYNEIPSLEETGIILKNFKDSHISYWHDTGHAEVMENLGFATHKAYLDLYGKYMLGIHLHNLKKCSDHRAPITGEFNFNRLKPYIKKDTLKVIEAHHPASAQDLIKSREFLEKIWDGKI